MTPALTELLDRIQVDEGTLRLLRKYAAEVAVRPPTSPATAQAFRRAAGVLREHDHLPSAVLCGRHELAVHRRRDDNPDTTASALLDLSLTYRAQRRPHKVIDCADQILETYGRHHHTNRHLNRALATALSTNTAHHVRELAAGTRQLPPPTS
ncbi:hypothetical protein [Saccharothrix lopnurensis]|uniref:Uncharacterized protein n=1 Tax=Saccharothrix lopnurensis TaxID=1670621 RepID=A0ABW1P4T1_9PSEU